MESERRNPVAERDEQDLSDESHSDDGYHGSPDRGDGA